MRLKISTECSRDLGTSSYYPLCFASNFYRRLFSKQILSSSLKLIPSVPQIATLILQAIDVYEELESFKANRFGLKLKSVYCWTNVRSEFNAIWYSNQITVSVHSSLKVAIFDTHGMRCHGKLAQISETHCYHPFIIVFFKCSKEFQLWRHLSLLLLHWALRKSQIKNCI